MPPTTETRTAIGHNSYLTFGLAAALFAGALFAGRSMEKLDSMEKKLDKVVVDVEHLKQSIPSDRR